jgi:predicted nucleic acid-binding protein
VIYFDAACIAKFYLDEPDSDAVRALAESAGEVLTVFHRKLREKAFGQKAFEVLCEQFEADSNALVWEWLPVSSTLVSRVSAGVRSLPAQVFLRAADALHLACAAEHGFREIYSNDRHLLPAAAHFGLTGVHI